jgi:hypothetical protein
MWGTAFESLRRLAVRQPEKHIVLFRNWDTYTICVFKRPVMQGAAIKKAIQALNFDLVYMQNLKPEEANIFNRYDEPYYYNIIQTLANAHQTQSEDAFYDRYLLDVRPQTDDRPYPGRYLKWHRLQDLQQSTGKRSYALILSGEIVIAAVFVEAVIISILLLGMPRLWVSNVTRRKTWRQTAYFMGIGGGFILVEIFFIQHYARLFGDPVISFAVVLAVILAASGAGGILAQRLTTHTILKIFFILISLLTFLRWGLPWYLEWALTWPFIFRYGSAIFILVLTGFVMGMPFTLGMRFLAPGLPQKASAWAANGCASVLGSIIGAQLAICCGISAIALGAAVAYLAAVLPLLLIKHHEG